MVQYMKDKKLQEEEKLKKQVEDRLQQVEGLLADVYSEKPNLKQDPQIEQRMESLQKKVNEKQQ